MGEWTEMNVRSSTKVDKRSVEYDEPFSAEEPYHSDDDDSFIFDGQIVSNPDGEMKLRPNYIGIAVLIAILLAFLLLILLLVVHRDSLTSYMQPPNGETANHSNVNASKHDLLPHP